MSDQQINTSDITKAPSAPESVESFKAHTNLLREDIRRNERHVRDTADRLRGRYGPSPLQRAGVVADHSEIIANYVLAIRHLEDARMRLGKAIQAAEGADIMDSPELLSQRLETLIGRSQPYTDGGFKERVVDAMMKERRNICGEFVPEEEGLRERLESMKASATTGAQCCRISEIEKRAGAQGPTGPRCCCGQASEDPISILTGGTVHAPTS